MSLLNSNQRSIIESLALSFSIEEIEKFSATEPVQQLSVEQLVAVLTSANACYRAGYPFLDDAIYDHQFLAQLSLKSPNHPYLATVEPEVQSVGKTVALPQKMLSTDKAYSVEEIKKWIDRVLKTAQELSIDEQTIDIRLTPKLDGYAAFDDGTTLYTRGDGFKGQDITRAFDRGLQVANNGARGQGAGEIVIKKSYFEQKLSAQFENSRNIQAAIIAEKNIDEAVQTAIELGACVFYPFKSIEHITQPYQAVIEHFDELVEKMWQAVDFDIDGVVLEVTNEDIKQAMGATRHHHRWQIAFKVNNESAEVEVVNVIPQTSRTGRVSPVAELVPTKLSGATISRATVHHYNMVKTLGVGPGAIVKLVRSGLVIPKIEQVIHSVEPQIPDLCPSCGSHLIWESDHLICPNKTDCQAQTENTLIHFFRTLGNNDGFGPKVIEKLHGYGIKHIHDIYQLQKHQFVGFGFGDKTAQNLVDQLEASKQIAVDDWRFLSAFGVTRLAGGNCEKLLQHHDLISLFDLSVEQIVTIDGFAQLSAEAIVEGLRVIKTAFFNVYNLGFNLVKTEKMSEKSETDSAIFDKQIVFTGSMVTGKRGDMEKQAKLLGAKVGKSVTSKTDFLVTGEKVGANKINAAKDKGVTVLTESDYIALLSN